MEELPLTVICAPTSGSPVSASWTLPCTVRDCACAVAAQQKTSEATSQEVKRVMRASGGREDLTAGKAATWKAWRQERKRRAGRKENGGPKRAVRELRSEKSGPKRA